MYLKPIVYYTLIQLKWSQISPRNYVTTKKSPSLSAFFILVSNFTWRVSPFNKQKPTGDMASSRKKQITLSLSLSRSCFPRPIQNYIA